MPMFNAGPYLRPALESILAQTFAGFRFLIIDDGSTDASAQIARSYADPRILVWEQANAGPGAAMNRALAFALEQGIPYLARMDADDISLPSRLEKQLAILSAHPQAAACSANCQYIHADTGEVIGASTVSSAPWLIRWEILHGLRGLIQGACMFRVNALYQAGGYRAAFSQAEETDVFLRLVETFELDNAPDFLYQIRLRPDSISLANVHRNVLYQFYALDCSHRRRHALPERDFTSFQASPGPGVRFRIWREEAVLKYWRRGMGRRALLTTLLAALLDPRRVIIRALRKFTATPR